MPELDPDRHLLAFDFGMKRIGVAIGQLITKTASPLSTLDALDGKPDWEQVNEVLRHWDIQAVVVGIPLKMDDSLQHTSHAAQQFANRISKRYDLPVYCVDEKLTTKAAKQALFESGGYQALQNSDIDSFAAKIILEQWMRTQI